MVCTVSDEPVELFATKSMVKFANHTSVITNQTLGWESQLCIWPPNIWLGITDQLLATKYLVAQLRYWKPNVWFQITAQLLAANIWLWITANLLATKRLVANKILVIHNQIIGCKWKQLSGCQPKLSDDSHGLVNIHNLIVHIRLKIPKHLYFLLWYIPKLEP